MRIIILRIKQIFNHAIKIVWIVLFLIICGTPHLYSQSDPIQLGDTLRQNFNSIGTSPTFFMPGGWRLRKEDYVRTFSDYTINNYQISDYNAGNSMSSTAPAGFYNFRDGININDRAVGGISSSGFSYQSINIMEKIVNSGVSLIEKFKISYSIEKYRNGSNPIGFRIQMAYGTSGTSWTNAGADFLTSFPADANNNGYTIAPVTTLVENKYLNVSLNSNSFLYLTWNYSILSGTTTSNSQALALDNVLIIPIAKPTVNTLSCTSATTSYLIVKGEITNVNGDLATERGFIIYEADGTDKIIGQAGVLKYAENGLFNTGQFIHMFNNLCPGKTYSIRAYAINACGITYATKNNCTTLFTPLLLNANQPICENNNFSIQATLISGATYHWTNSTGIIQSSTTNILNLNLPAATYTYNCYYTLACGYTSLVSTITITISPKPLTSNIYHN